MHDCFCFRGGASCSHDYGANATLRLKLGEKAGVLAHPNQPRTAQSPTHRGWGDDREAERPGTQTRPHAPRHTGERERDTMGWEEKEGLRPVVVCMRM